MLKLRLVQRWVPIRDFPFYQISNFGGVRSIDREIEDCNGMAKFIHGKPLKPALNVVNGYLYVMLYADGKRRNCQVHRLVLEGFDGPCPEGCEGCHNNGIKTDNWAINLRWDTKVSNAGDCLRHGTRQMGERHHQAKLSYDLVKWIRVEADAGRSYEEIAAVVGVTPNTARCAHLRVTWKEVA